ncbi:EmrB/QacA subfamily drug resistance transporter [Lipingzhangella halophila]|uniref:EmrB/QacA subfamily drug resistance transporter n=1 Tax=Lipingzhangella halophila TaxID=1783352 RepID=A0A7W7W3X4_9ACTN|nr:MFS transporter [Lipingzhangella halophila]MBB4933522.1 EmrB/QacA subfamily drug resistance transporter [Lipingzhangella halophila]
MAQLMVVLDVSVVNVALPSIQTALTLSAALSQWVASAYTLTFAGTLLVGARIADVVGARRALIWGLAGFTAASLVGGIADSGWMLIGARAAQGVGAAVVSPATFTLLTTTYPEGAERTRAVAVWTGVSLVGGGLGNILSGTLTEYLSWRAVLLVNIPIGAAAILGALALALSRVQRPAARVDLTGAVLATTGLGCVAYAVSGAGTDSGLPLAPEAALLGVGLLAALVAQQRRSHSPLVPASLLRNRAVVAGNVLTVLAGACFQVPLWYFLTFQMQHGLGYTALQAGMAFLPMTLVTMVFSAWVTPVLMRRVPSADLVAAGAALATAGLVWQWLAVPATYVSTFLGPALVIGVGGGLLNTPLATAVTTGVAPEDAGAASGLMNTSKQFGGAIGLAAFVAFIGTTGDDYRLAFLAMAALTAAVAGLAVTLRPRPSR